MRSQRLLPGYRKHSTPIRRSYPFFLLIFSCGHGLLLAWEGDPKIEGVGGVKSRGDDCGGCVYMCTVRVTVCKAEWSCWKDKKIKKAKSCRNSV